VSAQIGRHLAAIVVPFKDTLDIDEPAFRKHCRDMLAIAGIDGIVVNANASEVDTMDHHERVRLVEIAAEEAHAAGKIVVSGVTPQPGSYKVAATMAKDAEKAGADALLLLGPAIFGRGVELVPEVAEQFTRAVANAVSLPIIYFVAGALSGINYTPDVVKRICSVDQVVAIKDTMWSPQGFDVNLRLLRDMKRGTKHFSGNDNCFFYNFVAGADGTLLVLHCVMGKEIVAMFDHTTANNVAEARRINEIYEPLVALLFARPMLKMPTRIKHVLQVRGQIEHTFTRAPVPPLTPAEADAITKEVRKIDLRNEI
jgi:4-hydroxy-tetrahydrodipicolinate synthase